MKWSDEGSLGLAFICRRTSTPLWSGARDENHVPDPEGPANHVGHSSEEGGVRLRVP